MRKKTLLALGDEKDFDSFVKFVKQRKFFSGSPITFASASYSSLFKGQLPNVRTDEIIILPFFPFDHWDKHIETKTYRGVYGTQTFYTKFKQFWGMVARHLKRSYPDRKIAFLNDPSHLARTRDKVATKRLMSRAGVSVPQNVHVQNAAHIEELLDSGRKLFIKVRFGSMGKGITYLEKGRWMTNFRFRSGKILSRKSDHGWTFVNVTENRKFLRELLKKDVFIEEAVDPLLVKGRKFDLRMYVFKNRLLYTYGRTNAPNAVTTNISQGARGEKCSFDKTLPKLQLAYAGRQAVSALKAANLIYGGVDMMLSTDRRTSRCLEINAFPGLPRTRRFNLARFLIAEIIKEYGR